MHKNFYIDVNHVQDDDIFQLLLFWSIPSQFLSSIKKTLKQKISLVYNMILS